MINWENDIFKIMSQGESEKIEFKSANKAFPKDALCTISAFANTDGGFLILGVSEKNNKFYLSGVPNANRIIDDLFNRLNNPEQINRNVIHNDNVSVISIKENDQIKDIIVIRVEKVNYKNLPIYLTSNPYRAYYRQGTGDYMLNSDTVNAMIRDSSEEPYDSCRIAEFSIEDLDKTTVSEYRKLFTSVHPEHPFNSLSQNDFLLRINAISSDRKTNRIVPTVAGLLVFGKHISIKEYLPHYNVEYIHKSHKSENQSFDDRIIYDGLWGEDNLFTFFNQVINKLFLTLHSSSEISDDFITRKSISRMQIAIREALVNSIIHCDYKNKKGILIIRYPDRMIFQNGGSLRISKHDYFSGGQSDPRNYYIQEIFRLVNLCEKAGSGVPKIMEAVKNYKLKSPEINSTFDSFELVLWDTSIIESENITDETQMKIVELIVKEKFATINSIAEALGIHRNTSSKHLNILFEKGILDKNKQGNQYLFQISQTEDFIKYDVINMIHTIAEELKRK